MEEKTIIFTNYAKFSPVMLQNHIWRRNQASFQSKEEHKTVGRLKSFAKFKQSQLSKKNKKVSFRNDLKPRISFSDATKPSSLSSTDSLITPSIETFNSILLFVDISGFTRLCTKLSPETTRYHINSYFTLLMDIIYEFGGDVHKFIGDAIIVIWPVASGISDYSTTSPLKSKDQISSKTESSDDDVGDLELQRTALTALDCAIKLIHSECSHYDKKEGDVDVKLRMHIGITCGKLHCYHVGTTQQEGNIWEYVIAGKPLEEMASALDNAHHGEIGVSPKLYQNHLKGFCIAKTHKSGNFIVSKLHPNVQPDKPENLAINQSKCNLYKLLKAQKDERTYKLLYPPGTEEADSQKRSLQAVSDMVPSVARVHCESNSLGFLSELRKVTILFINIGSLIPFLDNGDIKKVQQCMEVLSNCVLHSKGNFIQFVYDDKGVVAILAFGLPGNSHENDVDRGLRCALMVHKDLDSISLACHIGITTGQVYCGLVGSSYRSAFGIMGASMNLSARLMGICMKLDKSDDKRKFYLICNEEVKKEALQSYTCSFTFDKLEPVLAKGYDKPVNIFVPRRTMLRTDSKKDIVLSSIRNKNQFYSNPEIDEQIKKQEREQQPENLTNKGVASLGGRRLNRKNFIGRKSELQVLADTLLKDNYNNFRIMFVVGPAGIGKSTILRNFALLCLKEKQKRTLNVISLRGDSDSLGPPLECWGHVIRSALNKLYHVFNPKTKTDKNGKLLDIALKSTTKTMETLSKVLDRKYKSRVLLFSSFFPSLKGIPLSSDLKALQGSQQGMNLQLEMIIDLLIKFSIKSKKRFLLLVEDAHYFDILSWRLLEELSIKQPDNISILCTTRPFSQSHSFSNSLSSSSSPRVQKEKVSDFALRAFEHIKQKVNENYYQLILTSLNKLDCKILLKKLLEDEEIDSNLRNASFRSNAASTTSLSISNKSRKEKSVKEMNKSVDEEEEDDDDVSVTSVHSEDSIMGSSKRKQMIENILNSPDFIDFVFQRCAGNPLFLLGLADVIESELNLLLIAKTTSAAEQGIGLDEFYTKIFDILPENIHAVNTARFDKIGNFAQLVLKTVSVIGFTFTSIMLKELFYEKNINLKLALKELVDAGFLVQGTKLNNKSHSSFKRTISTATSTSHVHPINFSQGIDILRDDVSSVTERSNEIGEYVYSFEHRLVFDSISKLLLTEQKAEIHEKLAEYYERRYRALLKYTKSYAELSLTPKNSFHLKRLKSKRFSDLELKLQETQSDSSAASLNENQNRKNSGSQTQLSTFTEEELEGLSLYKLNMKLAFHWSKTFNLPKAVQALRSAAKYSIKLGAYSESSELYQAALMINEKRLEYKGINIDGELKTSKQAKRSSLHELDVSDTPKTTISVEKLNIPEGPEKVVDWRRKKSSFNFHSPIQRQVSTLSSMSPRSNLGINRTDSANSIKLQDFKSISLKDILSEGVLISSSSASNVLANDKPEALLSELTEDICALIEMFTRYKVNRGKFSLEYLFEKAEFTQTFLKMKYNETNAKAMSLVYHSKAFYLFSTFNKEFDNYLDTLKAGNKVKQQMNFSVFPNIPIPAGEDIEEYFSKAIELRRKNKDGKNMSDSLNGLGSFYHMFLKKVKKSSAALLAAKDVDNFLNSCIPEKVRKRVRKEMQLCWHEVMTDKLKLKLLVNSLIKCSKEKYIECKDIRLYQYRSELGQVYVSLGSLHLSIGNLKVAEKYFQDSIKEYTMTQGSRNPRSAYALQGLADCHLEHARLLDKQYIESSKSSTLSEEISVNEHKYLALSLSSLCIELRKLTITTPTALDKQAEKMLADMNIVWPWEKQTMTTLSEEPLTLTKILKSSDSEIDFISAIEKSFAELNYFVGWSSRYSSPVKIQRQKILLSFKCLYWVYHHKYESLVECQVNQDFKKAGSSCKTKSWHFLPLSDWYDNKLFKIQTNNLTLPQFNLLRFLFYAIIHEQENKVEDLDLPLLLLVEINISNLFKVEAFTKQAHAFLEEKQKLVYFEGKIFGEEELDEGENGDLKELNIDEIDLHLDKLDDEAMCEIDEAGMDFIEDEVCVDYDREILVKIIDNDDACVHFLPSVATLTPNQKKIITLGFSTGFELKQFISLESVPGSLTALKSLANSKSSAFDVYLRHLVLNIAGSKADLSTEGSLQLQYEYCDRLLEVVCLLDEFKRGKNEKVVYAQYLLKWSRNVHEDGALKSLPMKFRTAVVRLCGMLKAYREEEIKMVVDSWKLLTDNETVYLTEELEKNGIDDWAIVPTSAPELLSLFVLCVDEIELVSEFDEEASLTEDIQFSKQPEIQSTSIALSFGLQLLIKVFRSARVILKQSKLIDQYNNGVYEVKATHLAKEHVVRMILREERFVKFSIFHQNRSGEIVLGNS